MSQDSLLTSDCKDALIIPAKGIYRFEKSLIGYGDELEIYGNPKSSFTYFQREHNTAWFILDMVTSGDFVFYLTPADTSTDFDFLLFEKTNDDYCNQIKSKTLRPVRTNISRNNTKEWSITVLSAGAKEPLVRYGLGNHKSQSVEVKKGDQYILVIDNVQGDGKGFRLNFNYYEKIKLTGEILNEETKSPVKNATLTWSENTGEVLAEYKADSTTGKFQVEVPVRKGGSEREYTLSVESEGHFFQEKIFSLTTNSTIEPLLLVLPSLKKGNKMILSSVNFFGNSAIPLPESIIGRKQLKTLMKKNPSLKIRIDGHTNGCENGVEYSQKLSEDRAKAIKQYLVKNKIESDRIETQGLNCSQMLFPFSTNENEQKQNRRIEIMVLEY